MVVANIPNLMTTDQPQAVAPEAGADSGATLNISDEEAAERSGIGVARLETLGATDTASLGRITAPEVDALARATVDDSHDALFIACAQLPTFEILDALRADLGRPVWSSIAATATLARELAATHG